jgi:hypothetical protein
MTRYIVGALGAIAIIVAIGIAIDARWFGVSEPRAARSIPSAPPAPVRPGAGSGSGEPVRGAVMIDVKGRVEKRAGSVWVVLDAAEHLTVQDTIRTASDAEATIDIGGATVLIAANTEITVGEITSSVSQLSLTEGRIKTNAGQPGGPTIRISTRDAIAEADAGTFDVLSTGNGAVTVAAEDSHVKLTAHGASVDIPAGRQSTVVTGAVPSAPTRIPASLFLKVSVAGAARSTAALRGETQPGVVLSINGIRAETDADGRFTADVPLRKGDNVIVVSVIDALGRREQRLIKKSIGMTAPRLETEVQWQ